MNRSIEQMVDLRCRMYEYQQQKEAAERRARAAALAQNKADITAPQPKTAEPAPTLQPLKKFTIRIG